MKLKNIGLALFVAGVLVAGILAASREVRLVNLKAKKDKYLLILVQSVPGMGMMAIDKVLITDPVHKPDGALCFLSLKDSEKGCIKSENYFLKQVNE